MHLLSDNEQQVRDSLREAIILLCQTGLKFTNELSVDGLLAVTVDKKDVVLLSIKETLQGNESVASREDAGSLCIGDRQDGSRFEWHCPVTEASVGIRNQTQGINEQEQWNGQLLPADVHSQGVHEDPSVDCNSVAKSRLATSGNHRKHKNTIRRYLDPGCQLSSLSSASFSVVNPLENISDWGNDKCIDMPGGSTTEDERSTNDQASSELFDTKHAMFPTETLADQSRIDSSDQECREAVSSLVIAAEGEWSEGDIEPVTVQHSDALPSSEQMSKRSYRKRRHAVCRYLDTVFPVASSSSELLGLQSQTECIPGWQRSENSNISVSTETDAQASTLTCKLELVDNFPDSGTPHGNDLVGSSSSSDNVMTSSIESVSSVASQLLISPPHGVPLPSSNQQLAMMPPFALSAVVANMQSQFAMLPWSVRAFPGLTPPSSVLPADGGMLTGLVASSSSCSGTKGKSRSHRYSKATPLNIPTVNSYRRLNGVKSSPFMSPEVNVCANCGVTRTTVWRRLENKQILCNACGCYFKLHKVHRPLSLVRQEIRSRCRGPKMATLMKTSKSRYNGVLVSQPPPDVALNLTTSPRSDETK